ncbi:hypothetical protein H5410_060264, partial [Solanum commersonii]
IIRSRYNLCHSLCPLGEHFPANHIWNVNRTRQALCNRFDSEGIEGDRSRVIYMNNHPPNQLSHPEGQNN